ncbi:MAG TPA: hypothetical protein VK203_11320 [Nostocaceae cyanobacterium]|nr:hypothetical protein [Nostocaceae cyanobacterium]
MITDNWNASSYLREYYFRKEGRFEFYLDKSYLRVTLTKHKTLDQIVVGKMRFCITEDNSLSSLGVYDLSAKEMNQIIGRLKHGQPTIGGRVEN